MTKRLKAEDNPKKAFRPEENQKIYKCTASSKGKESSYKRRPRKAPGPRK